MLEILVFEVSLATLSAALLTMLSEHLLSPQWLFCHTELLQGRELLPHCPSHVLRDRLPEEIKLHVQRELEFSHICSPTLKYFPTSICPFEPTSKATGATNYSLSVPESMWTGFRQHVAQLGAL